MKAGSPRVLRVRHRVCPSGTNCVPENSLAQTFHPFANALARATIYGALGSVVVVIGVLYAAANSDYTTQVRVVRPQPVDFSHQHHVAGLGLDCRYCHSSVETSSFAGVPATEVCMNCHSQIWSDSPKLEPVRASFRTGKPLAWTRVTDLPDFVHFEHSIHVQKGIACTECHGEIDKMPLTWRAKTLQMRWCLDCHRTTEEHVRPRSDVFLSLSQSEVPAPAEREELSSKYRLRHPTDCSACHY